MPLFGSKKQKDEKAGGYPAQPSYPTQQPMYPQQAYPTAPGQQPAYGMPPGGPPQGYGAPPQGYGAPPGYPGAPQHPVMGAQGQGPPPPYTQYPGPPPQQRPPPQTYVVQGAFDAGARFDGISRPNIPPPPPGCLPNAAQVANMHGHQVVATQQRGDFISGGSDGGYTIF